VSAALDAILRARDARPDAVIAIVGPTASGKTELAVRAAERLRGEIVSADSVQVYRGFDAGSGKPTREERARAPHHVVDVVDPMDPFDAARYASLAREAAADIEGRGRIPIVCGGTFLWTKALFHGLSGAPPADARIRARHRERVATEGPAALHADLARVDPRSAARLHPNDVVRTGRALEVHELSGRPLSAWQDEHAFGPAWREPAFFAVRRAPDAMDARIAARVHAWLGAGWIDEVSALVARGHGGARAMESVGYREVKDFLAGTLAREDLAPRIVQSTRIFARRQRTWLNRVDVTWLDA
jgi:tRNA dimethylallyltransferase